MTTRRPVLTVVCGLPATGKSTVAALLARRLGAPYLRVDRVEQTLVEWSPLEHPVGAVGYAVTYALAAEQLDLGLDVVVECVNPLTVTRQAWVDVAAGAGAGIVQAELVCSDAEEHRRRVTTRETDVPGLVKPTWEEVVGREYDGWSVDHLTLDTAVRTAAECAEAAADAVAATRGSGQESQDPLHHSGSERGPT